VKEINAQLDALLLGGELKQNSMRTNMAVSIAKRLREELAAMIAERDALKSENADYAWHNEDLNMLVDLYRPKNYDDKDTDDRLIDQLLSEVKEIKQQTASRCAEFVEVMVDTTVSKQTLWKIASAIRKEFNL